MSQDLAENKTESPVCGACTSWAGVCLKGGKVGRVAGSEGCEQFMARTRLKGGKAPNG
jgi:hypothetical protein